MTTVPMWQEGGIHHPCAGIEKNMLKLQSVGDPYGLHSHEKHPSRSAELALHPFKTID